MEPPLATGDTNKIAVRLSIMESICGCGILGIRIDKEDLKKQLAMPQYLRFAMHDSIRLQDLATDQSCYLCCSDDEDSSPPPSPMVVFINPHSGNRHGPALKECLQQLISDE